MNTSKWIPYDAVVPLMLTNKEKFEDGPFHVGTAFWVKFPPYDDVFLITARHCLFDGEIQKGNLSVPLEQREGCTVAVRFSHLIQDNSENPEDIIICVVDPDRKEQLELLAPRCLPLDHQYDVDMRLTAMLAAKGKLRTVGFPGSDKEIDYDNKTAFARPRGFIGTLTHLEENGRYRLERASWADADGHMEGFSGSPIIDLVATEINLNSLPSKVIPTEDGRVVIAFKTDEDTPHRAVPAGILVTGSNNIAHFVPINVVTNLIAEYLVSKL